MKILKVSGDIVNSAYGDFYEWFGMDYTSPKSVQAVLDTLEPGEDLRVEINSGGGEVFAGQEIYSKLRAIPEAVAYVESIAASSASIIAMGCAKVLMSPAAMLMIHNVWSCASGDHNDMSRMAKTLDEMDKALAQAYMEHTGKSKDEILKLMEKETWLPADKAIEQGFADGYIERPSLIAAGVGEIWMTPERAEEAKRQMAAAKEQEKLKAAKENDIKSDLWRYGIIL